MASVAVKRANVDQCRSAQDDGLAGRVLQLGSVDGERGRLPLLPPGPAAPPVPVVPPAKTPPVPLPPVLVPRRRRCGRLDPPAPPLAGVVEPPPQPPLPALPLTVMLSM